MKRGEDCTKRGQECTLSVPTLRSVVLHMVECHTAMMMAIVRHDVVGSLLEALVGCSDKYIHTHREREGKEEVSICHVARERSGERRICLPSLIALSQSMALH